MNNKERFDEIEAANYLGISKVSLIRRRREGSIGYYQVGRKIFYGLHHLNSFLNSCERNSNHKKDVELNGDTPTG
jgi:hypothetical protein